MLSGANSYQGLTSIDFGSPEVRNTSTNSAVVVLGQAVVVVGNLLQGPGSLVFSGPDGGVTTMNDNNLSTFSGVTTIASSIVNVLNSNAFGSGVITMAGGALRATEFPAKLSNAFVLSGTVGFGAETNITGAVTLAGARPSRRRRMRATAHGQAG